MKLQRRQVLKALEDDFGPHVNISDIKNHGEQTISEMRASRALAALAFASRAKIEPKVACSAITDESNDHGLDLVGISEFKETLYLIQSKTSDGAPGLTDVQKFNSGIRAILKADFDALGPKVQSRKAEIEEAFNMRNLRVCAIFSHLGTNTLSSTVVREKESLLEDINSSGEIIEYEFLDLGGNHSIRNTGSDLESIDSKITLTSWTSPSEYKNEILGIVPRQRSQHCSSGSAIDYSTRTSEKQ